MISRHWRGVARADAAERYVVHLVTETFPGIARIEGFVSAAILRRPLDGGVEFIVVTTWRSMAAIERFAGKLLDDAVVPQTVQEMMIEFDRHVTHYQVAGTYPSAGDNEDASALS